jgi:hypothetical protein
MCDNIEAIFAEAIQSCQTRYSVMVDRYIAEESLILVLEYMHKERLLGNVWIEKCRLERVTEKLERERDRITQEKYTIEQEKNQITQEKYTIEQEKNQITQEKCAIEQERDKLAGEKHELSWQKEAMETSKFWKMRKLWFNLKQKVGFSRSK